MSALILVVDDDEDVREVTKLLLEAEGYRVSTAIDGVDAWEQLSTGERPQLILLDVTMPRMDGIELLQRLRGASLDGIPVVLMSAHDGTAERAAELVVSGTLTKPVELDRLFDTVRAILSTAGHDSDSPRE